MPSRRASTRSRRYLWALLAAFALVAVLAATVRARLKERPAALAQHDVAPAADVDAQKARRLLAAEAIRLAGEGITERRVLGDVEEVALGELEAYQERLDCVLANGGFLDLYGRVWSCTVAGDGWVEVTVVEEQEDGGSCAVLHVRMDAAEWQRELQGG